MWPQNYPCSRKQVVAVWDRDRQQKADGVDIDLRNRRLGNSGRKRIDAVKLVEALLLAEDAAGGPQHTEGWCEAAGRFAAAGVPEEAQGTRRYRADQKKMNPTAVIELSSTMPTSGCSPCRSLPPLSGSGRP